MKEIFLYFFKLGLTGFGGPLAVIAQMQKDLAAKKQWISTMDFRSLFALIKAMPGPVAFQMGVAIAYRRKGFKGALAAAVGLVLPAFSMMILISVFYRQLNEHPLLVSAFSGMQIAAFVLIFNALFPLSRDFFKEGIFWVLLISGFLLSFLTTIPEPVLIIIFGMTGILIYQIKVNKNQLSSFVLDPHLWTLFLVCFQAGAFVFGTGLAIVPILESEFVTRLQWISRYEFLDAISFGQITPGPIVVSVTFIGYQVAGLVGAFVATFGIFLAAFVHMVTWFPRVTPWLQKQKWISSFSLAVTAVVMGGILVSLIKLSSSWSVEKMAISVGFIILAYFYQLPSWAIVLLGFSGGLGMFYIQA